MTCRLFLFASVLLFSTCANAERHDDSTGEFLSDIPASAASNHRGDDMLLSLLAESSNGAEESKDAATAADDVAVFDSCEDDDVRLEASTQRAFKTCAEVPVEMCTDKTYTKVARKYCPKRCDSCGETIDDGSAPVPAPTPLCVDDGAGVKALSGGKVASCKVVRETKELCKHDEHGELVRQYCPAACGVCVPTISDPKPEDPAVASKAASEVYPFYSRLCLPNEACTYISRLRQEVGQSTQGEPKYEETRMEFTITHCTDKTADGYEQRQMVVTDARMPKDKQYLKGVSDLDETGKFKGEVQEEEDQARINKMFGEYPYVFSLAKDGALKAGYCHKKETKEVCDLKKLMITQAVKEVLTAKPVPKERVETAVKDTATDGKVPHNEDPLEDANPVTSLLQQDHEFKTSGVHPEHGRYETHHTQKYDDKAGTVKLMATRLHDEIDIKNDATGDVEDDVTKQDTEQITLARAKFSTTSKVIVNKQTQKVVALEDEEDVVIDMENRNEQGPAKTKATTMFLQEDDVVQGRVAEPEKPVGKTKFKQLFWMALKKSKTADGNSKCHASSVAGPTTSFLQVDLKKKMILTNNYGPQVDLNDLRARLHDKDGSFGSMIFHFSNRPDALHHANDAVRKWLRQEEITPEQFGRFLGALGGVRNLEGERCIVKHLQDPELCKDPAMTDALNNGLVSLLGPSKRDEQTIRAVNRIAGSVNLPKSLRRQALHVLGGLLHPFEKLETTEKLPNYASEAFETLMNLLRTQDASEDGDELVVAINALGNSRWKANEQAVRKHAARHDNSWIQHSALDALIKMPKLSNETYHHLATFVSDHDWRNKSHPSVTYKTVQMLQMGMKVSAGFPITFFSRRDDITRSDIHSANTLLKVGADIARRSTFTAKGAIEACLIGFCLSEDYRRALLSAGFEAFQKEGNGKWKKTLFLDLIGYRLYGSGNGGETDPFEPLSGNPNQRRATERAIGGGPFDFDTALEAGVNERMGVGGFADDKVYSRSFVNKQKTFCFSIVCVSVKFDMSGKAGVIPALFWGPANSGTFIAGVKPYAGILVTVELGIDLGILRGGVGGELWIIKAGAPAYGRVYNFRPVPQKSCGSLELELSALSGRLYIWVDYYCFWCWCKWGWFWKPCFSWKRAVDYTILRWNGFHWHKQFWATCNDQICRWKRYSGRDGYCHRHHRHRPHRHHPHRHHGHSRRRRWRL
jgi:hypothetical protein